MNKVQEVLSKIKLKDYEKQWLLSWAGYVVLLIFLPLSAGSLPKTLLGIFAIIFLLWSVANVCGLIFCSFHIIKDWIDSIGEETWIYKTIRWFSTSDRY